MMKVQYSKRATIVGVFNSAVLLAIGLWAITDDRQMEYSANRILGAILIFFGLWVGYSAYRFWRAPV